MNESKKNDKKQYREKFFFRASSADFKKIPGSPIAYWAAERIIEIFTRGRPLGSLGKIGKGSDTGKNDLFIRCWFEINFNKIELACSSAQLTLGSPKKFYPTHKGGGFKKWYGNRFDVLNWHNDGAAIRNFPGSTIRNYRYYFEACISWGKITSSKLSVRQIPLGSIADDAGPSAFLGDQNSSILGLLNSCLTEKLISFLSPTLNFQVGDISSLPILQYCQQLTEQHKAKIDRLVEISQNDWNFYETSWDFTSLPLIQMASGQWPVTSNEEVANDQLSETSVNGEEKNLTTIHWPINTKLSQAYTQLRAHWQAMTDEMQRLEEENNRIFIDAYGLQDELTPEVPLSEITLTCNPHYRYQLSGQWLVASDQQKAEELERRLLEDTMKEFVSYAVGCMFGRYSLDMPGLVLANQGEGVADFIRKVASGQLQEVVASGQWPVTSEEGEQVEPIPKGSDGQLSEMSENPEEDKLTTSHWPLTTSSNNPGDNDAGEKLQGSDFVAESYGSGAVGLPSKQDISQGGSLRFDQSATSGGSFDSVQHSGRTSQALDGGVQELSIDSEGLIGRSGNPAIDRNAAQLSNRGSDGANHVGASGSQQNDPGTDGKTSHWPLATGHFSFLPVEDNVIPILNGDWFQNDMAEQFRKFLKLVFGTEHYEENIRFVEDALNSKNKRQYSIRDYFLNEFYADHIKRYKKRPIYWLFSSPKGSFNALIYMHRYRPDSASVVLNDYLREFRTKLSAHKSHQEAVSISASAAPAEKTRALKEIENLRKILEELDDYERETLYPLAIEQKAIDLDDGVKVNYPKFGAALKKIPVLEAAED